MREQGIKAAIAAAFGALISYLGGMAVPLIVLCVVMIMDYVSGLAKGYITKSLSSRVGLLGFIKKVSYLLVIAVAFVADWLLSGVISSLGAQVALPAIFGITVTVWFILNEMISILENLSQVGVPMPAFLVKLCRHLRVTVEHQVTVTCEDDDEEEREDKPEGDGKEEWEDDDE